MQVSLLVLSDAFPHLTHGKGCCVLLLGCVVHGDLSEPIDLDGVVEFCHGYDSKGLSYGVVEGHVNISHLRG